MDLLDRLLGHDAWTTRRLLLCCEGLPDAPLDREFDLGLRTLRRTFLHIVRNMEVWSDLMAGTPVRADGDPSVAGLLTRLDRAAADLARVAHDVAQRGAWDAKFLDHLDRPPAEKTFGGGVAHILTHSMHHRAQAIHLIVRRRADGEREALDRVRLSPEEGVPGDRWGRRLPRKPQAQITVVQLGVARLVANGQPLTVSGDNLVVDLDLSAGNLPAGTRLRVGGAVVEVSKKPHNGCSKFAARFGADAFVFVREPRTRQRNLRGVYWTVVEAGEAKVGDPVVVLSRG